MFFQVVALIEKKHSRACTGTIKPLQDKNPNRALFAPSDNRVPRLLIPMSDCPKGLLLPLLYSPLNIESDK